MSEVMNVPEGWEVKKINQIIKLNPESITTKYSEEFEIEYIDISSINDFKVSSIERLKLQNAPSRARRIVKDDYIIFSSVRPYLMAIAYIDFVGNKNNVICSTGYVVMNPKDNILNSRYLFYYSQQQVFIDEVMRVAEGSNYPAISDKEFKLLDISYPKEILEQQKIAKILSTLDQTIEATQKLIAKEKNIKKGLMHDLLTNGIDEKGKIRSTETHKYEESEIGLIPEGWKVDILGNIVKIVGGGTPARNIDEYWENGTIPWVTVKDLHNKLYITNSEEKITLSSIDHSATNLIKANNVITSTRMGIGRFFINTVDIAINQDLKALIPKKGIDTIFLLWNLLYHGKKLEALGTGTTVKGILLSDLKTLKLLLPSSQEQQKIAKILTTQDKKIETEEKNLAKLKALKKGLMDDLLSGKVRVKV